MIDDITTICELGINCNGSVEIAKKLIDVASDAGCDYVKFQKRDVELVYSRDELDKPRESPWGTTTRQQKFGLEFNLDQYREIDLYCKSKQIGWFVSCWDVNSVDFIENNFDVPYHKIASALMTDTTFLNKLKSTNKKLIMSTGMSTQDEILAAASKLGDKLDILMHCTSTYPTKSTEMNMSYISALKWFTTTGMLPPTQIGFSNHYSGLLWVPLAIAYGAKTLEFHITLDRTMYGSDQAASLEPDGVKKLMDYVRLSKDMIGSGEKCVYDSEVPIAAKLRKISDLKG